MGLFISGRIVADLLYRKGKHTIGSELDFNLKKQKINYVSIAA
jgi:hypothetical protein